MRKYTRKRPHHEEIPDACELCRLCLEKCEESVPIFTDKTGNVCATLALRIMICVGLEISQEDCLPNSVCITCLNELERYYAFRKKCVASHQKLKSHLMAVQMKEYKTEVESQEQANVGNEPEKPEIDVGNKNDYMLMVNMDGTVKVCGNMSNLDKEINIGPFLNLQKKYDIQTNIMLSNNIFNPVPENENVSQNMSFPDVKMESVDKKIILESRENNEVSEKQTSQVPIMVPALEVTEVPALRSEVTKVPALRSEITKVPELTNEVLMVEATAANKEIAESIQEKAQVKEQTQAEWTQDLSHWLTDLLVQTGAVVRKGNVFEHRAHRVQMHTQNGDTVVIDLVEEDEEEEACDNRLQPEPKTEKLDSEPVIDVGTEADRVVPPGRHPCATCGLWFASRACVSRHARAVHARLRPFACARCPRRFAQKEVLTRHELVHQPSRPFPCGSCGKSFTQRSALVSHARSHAAGARALSLFRCPTCPKVFLHASGLSRHALSHSGLAYRCGCGRHFRDRSSLKRHQRTTAHTGDLLTTTPT